MLLSREAQEIFCGQVDEWFQTHGQKPVTRDTRCEMLIKVWRYLYAVPRGPVHRNPSSKQRDKPAPLPARKPPLFSHGWAGASAVTSWSHRRRGWGWGWGWGERTKRDVWIWSADVTVSSQCRGGGGGCGSLEVMCARIINLNTIKKLRGIKATVMR